MKKLLVVILAMVYLTSSTGASIHMHYCMGKLANRGFSISKPKICNKCGMKELENGNGCCRDEYKLLKNDIDQKTVEAGFQLIQLTSVVLPVFYTEIPLPCFSFVPYQNPVSYAPPRSAGVAVYIRNCIFLI